MTIGVPVWNVTSTLSAPLLTCAPSLLKVMARSGPASSTVHLSCVSAVIQAGCGCGPSCELLGYCGSMVGLSSRKATCTS